MRAAVICVVAGCEDVALPGGNRCADHAAEHKARLAASRAAARRSEHATAHRALYADPRWRRASAAFLRRNKWCADCGSLGVHELATDVDHVEPHKGDRALFWDRSNWQPLCHRCHSRKTAREVWHALPPGAGFS